MCDSKMGEKIKATSVFLRTALMSTNITVSKRRNKKGWVCLLLTFFLTKMYKNFRFSWNLLNWRVTKISLKEDLSQKLILFFEKCINWAACWASWWQPKRYRCCGRGIFSYCFEMKPWETKTKVAVTESSVWGGGLGSKLPAAGHFLEKIAIWIMFCTFLEIFEKLT